MRIHDRTKCYVGLMKEGLIASNNIAEPNNSGQMKSTTQLHLIWQFYQFARENYKMTSIYIFRFSLSKIQKPISWLKQLWVLLQLLSYSPVLMRSHGILGSSAVNGSFLFGASLSRCSCLLVGFSTPWSFSRIDASTSCCL